MKLTFFSCHIKEIAKMSLDNLSAESVSFFNSRIYNFLPHFCNELGLVFYSDPSGSTKENYLKESCISHWKHNCRQNLHSQSK